MNGADVARPSSRFPHAARLVAAAAVAAIVLPSLLAPGPARADILLSHRDAQFASGAGNEGFLALGTLLPLLTDGGAGGRHALRNGDALVTSALLAEGLKAVVRERRPDGSDRESFPSGHATAAFAIATMQGQEHPRTAALWYAGAALIADSRVVLHRHYWHDILAGAALGIGTALVEIHQPRGLLIAPVYPGDHHHPGAQIGFGLAL